MAPPTERLFEMILEQNARLMVMMERFNNQAAPARQQLFGVRISLFNKRYQCFQVTKQPEEDYITYAGLVNKRCEDFELNRITADQFKSLIFICGLRSPKESDRLLSKLESEGEGECKLETLIIECQRLHNLKSDTAMLERKQPTTASICAINKKKPSYQPASTSKEPSSVPRSPCWQCEGMHFVRDCQFSNHTCKVCNKTGHKEGYCNCFSAKPSAESKRKPKRKQKPNVNGIFAINRESSSAPRKFLSVIIDGVMLRLQFDTASDITVLSKRSWEKLGSPPLLPTGTQAKTASGNSLNIIGQLQCSITLGNTTKSGLCYVTNHQHLNLFGLDWIEMFELWSLPLSTICNQVQTNQATSIQHYKAAFPNVFNNTLGHCKKTKVQLFLKPDARPVFKPKRPVPFTSVAKVDAEIDRLEKLGIITAVDFSQWAAPIVVVRKPEVDDKAKNILTINTHRGLYRFNRLAPGVKSAPGAFQQLMNGMIADLEGVESFLDDIIVFSKTFDDHHKFLIALFNRLEEYGFHLREEKCNILQHRIKYLGHIVDADGLHPDPAKVEAIAKMPPPSDVTTLRSFLGAVNYYAKFVREMHQLRRPLDALLKKDVKFHWSRECQQSFDRFKAILQSDLLLTHFDPSLETIVAADASKSGIGAVIMRRFPDGSLKAIAHAAKSLTQAEVGYSQVEKEGLALVFAVTKFHRMLLGRKFTLQTDHQPLLRIFGSKKGIPLHTANRLQRWALTLLCYDFNIEYVSTNQFGYADVLSRLINNHTKPDEDFIIAVVQLEEDVRVPLDEAISSLPLTFRMVREATSRNPTLQKVIQFIHAGWPSSNNIEDAAVRQFYPHRESLSVIQNCLMMTDRLVIPECFRQRILKQLHRVHPGIERMKAIARSHVFWPKIDAAIETFVKQCGNCASHSKSPPKLPPQPWPQAKTPWERIHVDFAGPFFDQHFLVVVDAHSKWPEIRILRSPSTSAVVEFLEELFARFGNPSTIVSDNGSQFTSEQFSSFCASNGIQHLRSAPYHPQSNGQAERFVDTLKRSMLKINEGENINKTLQRSEGVSPTQYVEPIQQQPCSSATINDPESQLDSTIEADDQAEFLEAVEEQSPQQSTQERIPPGSSRPQRMNRMPSRFEPYLVFWK
ncbi:uncharacterized protein K02A2.6-like [Uranotaenia lowii]|uniref:uncharacterized protein K02A2.6-like n=1 Tax=Uranotaenia lowii TaxID=190385 RepID=UPI002479402D|nr:uncharacterized protein K02A2.6-like [Uranotaenia lowii]